LLPVELLVWKHLALCMCCRTEFCVLL